MARRFALTRSAPGTAEGCVRADVLPWSGEIVRSQTEKAKKVGAGSVVDCLATPSLMIHRRSLQALDVGVPGGKKTAWIRLPGPDVKEPEADRIHFHEGLPHMRGGSVDFQAEIGTRNSTPFN